MTLAQLRSEVRGFVGVVFEDLLKVLPGDANRDARVAAAAETIAALYEGEQRAVALTVFAEEVEVCAPRYLLIVRDFVRGDKPA
jgi:hypothetical protein